MLQVDLKQYASDALEDAMRLAQVKSLNSFTWSDCVSELNYVWSDIYNRIAMIDDGYYSTTVRLNTALTKLPPFVKNTLRVYAAADPIGFNRQVYRASGMNDLQASCTYHISGYDLYCPDATRKTVWLSYAPIAPMLFFTHRNRDPKLWTQADIDMDYRTRSGTDTAPPSNGATISLNFRQQFSDYGVYTLSYSATGGSGVSPIRILLTSKIDGTEIDITSRIMRNDYQLWYISCVYPYIFCTYVYKYSGNSTQTIAAYDAKLVTGVAGNRDFAAPYGIGNNSNTVSNVPGTDTQPNDVVTENTEWSYGLPKFVSGFYRNIVDFSEFIEYNPFDFTGVRSNVEYLRTSYNDKTGMGVVVRDWNDYDWKEKRYKVKELGFTPDTMLIYPCPEAYRYLVARLASTLAAINETEPMGVQKELVDAQYAFEAFCARDKSAWVRIDNVNGPTITDWL